MNGAQADTGADLVIRIDGSRPLSAEAVRTLGAVCDLAEKRVEPGVVLIVGSGAPSGSWTQDLDVALVSKWERAPRRLERLAATTVAVADGDCGGMALDGVLTTDYRIATIGARLSVPVTDGATWPGMTIYRLTQQAGVAGIRQAVLLGRPIDAGDARDLRLIDELAKDLDSALAVARARVGGSSGRELAIRRRLMLDATTTSFEDALGTHLAACERTLRRVAIGSAS